MIQIPKPPIFRKKQIERERVISSLTNSGLKPFARKFCSKLVERTSDYLDVRSSILSELLVWIWLTFVKTIIVENETK